MPSPGDGDESRRFQSQLIAGALQVPLCDRRILWALRNDILRTDQRKAQSDK